MRASRRFVWAGYAAFAWGLIFAAISFYWGAGGTLGIDTVWGSQRMSSAQESLLLIAVWVTGLLKLIKAKPTEQPAPTDHRVRRDKIDSFGKVTLRYLGRLRHIPVGTAHKNRKVQLLVAGPDVRIITEDGELIQALTLDPARNYQPLGGRWPVHNVLPQACTMS